MPVGVTLRDVERRKRFAIEYLKDLSGPKAAMRAGYTQKPASAEVTAFRLLRNPDVQKHLQALLEEQRRSKIIDANKVLEEIERIALVDVSLAVDPKTNAVKPIGSWPEGLGKCLSGIDVEELFDKLGEPIGRVKKLRFWDKTKSLEMLAKYLRLWVEKVEVTGKNGGPIVAKIDFSGLSTAELKKLAEGK